MSNNSQSSSNSRSLYLSELILEIRNSPAPPELIADVLEVCIEESLHRPTTFTLRIHNAYREASQDSEPWRHQEYFKIGDRISIGFAASTTKDVEFQQEVREPSVFEGEITAMGGDFNATSAYIVIQGSDVSHRLHRGRYNRSFTEKTDKEIVEKIAEECGIAISQEDNGIAVDQIDPSQRIHEYVFQENQTNMEFLRERAALIGFELFVQNNQIYFRKPKSNGSLQLKWLTNVESFNVRVDSAQQVSSVEVRSWDYSQKKLISATATKEEVITSVSATATTTKKEVTKPFNSKGSNINTAFTNCQPSPKTIVVDQPFSTTVKDEVKNKAQEMAQALCNELGREYVYADAKADGNPKIRPGKVVELAGMGPYSGQYYVTETRHIYSKGVYSTEFSVRGPRERTMLSTLAPKVRLQPGQTLMVGIVTHNRDPKGWGRVRVKLPTLTEEAISDWARVVGLGAGNGRGCYWLPEIDDEVLVGFEHGDIHRPYIIGGVWNGKDRTVETVDKTIKDYKVNVRVFKSRENKIKLVDESTILESTDIYGPAGIFLESASGQGLSIDDLSCTVAMQTPGLKIPGAPPFTTEVSVNPLLGANICSPVNVNIESTLGASIEAAQINLTAPIITLGPPPSNPIKELLKEQMKKRLKKDAPPPPPPPPPLAVVIQSGAPLTIVAPTVTILGNLKVTGDLTVTGTTKLVGVNYLTGLTWVGFPPLPLLAGGNFF